jgi:hypothetical protein
VTDRMYPEKQPDGIGTLFSQIVVCAEEGGGCQCSVLFERMLILLRFTCCKVLQYIRKTGGSRLVFRFIYCSDQSWLKTCLHEHSSSCASFNSKPLPTRLVNVGSEDGKNPSLHIASPGEEGSWVSLSHCWGTLSSFVTNTKNVEQMLSSITLDRLPKTFRDAILIARRLGFQYVWIDSLCILQDSHADWSNESTQMRRYNQGNVLTIAADRASGDHEGFLEPHLSSEDPVELPFMGGFDEIYRRQLFRGRQSLLPYSSFFVSTSNGGLTSQRQPLARRAWTLQEDWLSPRSIHFNAAQLIWECPEHTFWFSDTNPQAVETCTRRDFFSGRTLDSAPPLQSPKATPRLLDPHRRRVSRASSHLSHRSLPRNIWPGPGNLDSSAS